MRPCCPCQPGDGNLQQWYGKAVLGQGFPTSPSSWGVALVSLFSSRALRPNCSGGAVDEERR